MKIAITGGTGFIGQHLIRHFVENQHEVILISRSIPSQALHPTVTTQTWTQMKDSPQLFEGIDAIINLAGASINQRWTARNKQTILQSRLEAAHQIAKLVTRLQTPPQVVINAAGMSIYGTSLTETFTEQSPARIEDFLSQVCEQWEAAADQIPVKRVVKVRIGLVLGNDGGAFPKMSLPYRLGIGGKVGHGKQWLSWIHIEDMVRLIDTCLHNQRIQGGINATAPNPVTNDEFGRILGRVLHRPHWIPVPSLMMKLIFGELSTLLLDGQRVIPQQMISHGFSFRYPLLEAALHQLCSSKRNSTNHVDS